MKRVYSLLAAFTLGLLSMQPSVQADMVYGVVPYTDSDFSIAGTITTDGTFGGFQTPPFNFTAWNITFTDPSGGFTLNFNDSNSSWTTTSLDPLSPLSVTTSQIALGRPVDFFEQHIQLRLDAGNPGAGDDYLLTWTTSQSTLANASITIRKEGDFLFGHQYQTPNSDPLVIATAVPEPASIVLLGSVPPLLVVAYARRKGRSRKEA